MTLSSRSSIVLAAFLLAARASAATPDLKDHLAQGKLDADVGNLEAAAKAFGQVADAPDATPALRAEALIRLGSAKRAAGDYEGALAVEDRAFKLIVENKDRDALALFVTSLGEPLPGDERWAEIWTRVAFPVDRSDKARPVRVVEWPGVPRRKPGQFRGHPIQLHLVNGRLDELFRLFADITGLNVVVHPGVDGFITLRVKDMPWDEALERILSPNGLAYRWEGQVLRIAPADVIGTARRGAGPGGVTKYSGEKIDLDFKNVDIRSAFSTFAAMGSAEGGKPTIEMGDLRGHVTLKLNGVPWDQALDVIAQTNGLEWVQRGRTVYIGRRGEEGRSEPRQAVALPELTVDQVVLQGTVSLPRGGHLALLGSSGAPSAFTVAGNALRDAQVTAIDATSITFRRSDGREARRSLY
jgi:hypothetical protein